MRVDNTEPIIAAAKRRHELTRAKAIQAIRELDRAGTAVTFAAVAGQAGVSRSWLYSQPDIRDQIQQLRDTTSRSVTAPIPASQRHLAAAPSRGRPHRTRKASGRTRPHAAGARPAPPPGRPHARRTTTGSQPRQQTTALTAHPARHRSATIRASQRKIAAPLRPRRAQRPRRCHPGQRPGRQRGSR